LESQFAGGTLAPTLVDRTPRVARALPGRHALPREFIAQHQRARILAALAEETVEKGYRAVTVADIVRHAGIARNTFYENFSSKEDCFLAACDFAANEALGRVVDAGGKPATWPEMIRAGLGAFLQYVAGEPALARTCIVEALSAGPAGAERYERSIQAFVPFFRRGRKVSPHGDELPETLEEAIVGGIFWILYQRIVVGQIEQVEGLLGQLVEFSLTPYVGAEFAKRVAAAADTV
jgi:AcrR family transcriptional regulator